MLQDRHKGESCVIVCNGPSLNKIDLSFLRRHITIGLNKIFLGFKHFRFYPRYYVCVNKQVIAQSKEDINNLNCVKFISRNNSNGLINENALTYLLETKNPPHRFCKDIRHGIHEGWTVTYAALQIAYFLGFTTVFIIGMDHRYSFTGQPNETMKMNGPDKNHFSEYYFGYGQSWDNPDLKMSEESYAIARQVYEADNRKIYDATLDGACNIFEKIDYRVLM